MNGVLEAALLLQNFFLARQWRFCFIGGLAVQKWSEPRVTDDADVTLFTGFGGEEPYIDALLGWLEPRRVDAREFALRARVLLARTPSGVGVDIALGGMPFEELAIARARDVELYPGCRLRLCTPEDLIVFKCFAARPLDWRDVEMTIVRQGDAGLDWRHIQEQLRPLAELKEQPELLSELLALRERLRDSDA
jgi:hypothetical protein